MAPGPKQPPRAKDPRGSPRGALPLALTARLEHAGQSHLVTHAATLAPEALARFAAELEAVPWERLQAALTTPPPPLPPDLRPPQALTLRRQRNEPGFLTHLAALGRPLLGAGRVAAVLLAGGQGSRLGHAGPKGTFVLGPDPDRTLYAIHAERVLASSKRAGRPIPLVVLTGPDTDGPTREAFQSAHFFGLDPASVRFVRQGELPALDAAGRALLQAPGRLALSPDGHGGLFEGLKRSGTLAWLVDLGVEVLTTFQVDNPLARPLEPAFLGLVVERKASAAGKAVRKADPAERVGVFARGIDGRTRIVEYSELPDGGCPDLLLGSIAVHAFSLPWLASLAADPAFALPYHKAPKQVVSLDPGDPAAPPAPRAATKLEQFLFDLLPFAPRVAVMEVDRRREFAPVKNATGVDCPETARAAVAAEIARWHKEVGLAAPAGTPSLRPLVCDGPSDLTTGLKR